MSPAGGGVCKHEGGKGVESIPLCLPDMPWQAGRACPDKQSGGCRGWNLSPSGGGAGGGILYVPNTDYKNRT